jgi:hypothetical protein
MNKDLKATLITISMILGFTGIVSLVIAFPILVLWILVGITIFCGINIAILLWDSVRADLDKDEKHKREARLKKMMKDDEKLGLYDFDMDENDKNQIG